MILHYFKKALLFFSIRLPLSEETLFPVKERFYVQIGLSISPRSLYEPFVPSFCSLESF